MSISQVNLLETERALLTERLRKARMRKAEAPTIGRKPEGEPISLSFAQQRLWFLYQWEPDSPTYNIPLALRMVGRLNVTALREAFNEIVRRHQVLQMLYTTVTEEPVQILHPDPSLALEVVDLSTLPVNKREAEVKRLADKEAKRPFNLEGELPIRATLLRLDEAEHVLLLTMHHIVSDGWSIGVLVKELAALYKAFCTGQPSPLPELPIQYADFAYWQRNWLQGEVLDRQMAYWKEQLAGTPAVLELPADRPRPSISTHQGANYGFRLPPALTQAIRTLSRQEGVTPFMTLLAAFQALLHRYTGQDDIVVGSPISGRNRSEIEGLIGCFVNTLVLRTDLSGNPSGRELLHRVREVTLEAYAHQDLPFEKLVEELQPERSLSYSPLFQTMFVFNNTPQSAPQLPGLTIEYLDVDSGTAKFDLSLALEDADKAMNGVVTFNTDLFDAATIARMLGHFQTLLEGMVANPEQRVADLPLLTPAERRQLLTEWNQTQTTYPQVQCMHQLFEEQVARVPNAVAVVFEEKHYTYRELNQRANQLARYLQSVGVGPDVRVGLFVERSLDIMVGLLGILKAGGAYVPIDPIYPHDRIRFMLEDAQAPILLTQAHLAADLSDLNGARVICLDRDWDTMAQHSAENPPLAVTSSNLMYVLFTSGSTGRPKGVAVEHRHYLNYFRGILQQLNVSPGLSFAIVSTFAADLGSTMIWGSLCPGGQLHIISYDRATDPEALADYFRRHPIDVLKLVPSHFEALQVLPNPADIVPRQRLIFAGEACSWETATRAQAMNPNCVIQNHYGPTETAVAALTYLVPKLSERCTATLPLGQPLGNVRVYVLDAHMQPVPVGVPGELYIGGAGVSRGYLNRPALTAERFVPDPFSDEPGSRLYRTGDLARYLSDGTIEFLGRVDHQVKIRGYRVELGEIEAVLNEHPSVQDAVVIVREDTQGDLAPGGDRWLVAYVVPRPGHDGDLSHLRDFLRKRLPDYMVPTTFVTLKAIPLNPNGKVDRFALPAPDHTRPDSGAYFVAPRNEAEERIAAIWSEVLGIEQVGVDDNFFDLGGESFKAIRVVRKMGASVGVMDLFKRPTIRGLAEHLAQSQPKRGGLLQELTKPVPAQEKVISLVCVPYGGGSAITYQPLASLLPKNYSLYAIELPGHDYSRRDEALQPLEKVARQCVEEIKRDVTGPIAVYGHCLGGALAIEIARLLEEAHIEVVGIFLGGTFPSPRLPGKFFEWLARLLPSDRLVSNRAYHEFLRALGGFTDVMDPEELAFFMRSLRHDAREAEDYYTQTYATRRGEKLKAPILCIVGQNDRASEFYQERFKEWGFFSDSVDLAVIAQAGHYFLKYQVKETAQIITNQLAVWRGQTTQSPHLTANEPVSGSGLVKEEKPGKHGRYVAAPARRTVAPGLLTFFIVAFGQLVSMIGTGLTGFALGVWAYQRTGSVSNFAFIFVFTLLPGILVSPIAGAIADQWDRRTIMILSDVAAACGTLAIALLLWTGSLQVWHIYVTASIGSIANAFQRPAYMAAIAQLVPKQYLGQANGIVQLGGATGDLLAPLLGGALVVSIGLHGIVLIDFATFLFAVTTLLLVRFPNTLFRKREEPLLQEVIKGWLYIIKRPGLVAMVAFFVVVNYLFSIVIVLVTPLVLSFGSPAMLGTVMGLNGAGMLIGSLVMSLWGGTKRRAEGMIGFVMLFGLSVSVTGLRPSTIYPAIGLFGLGFSVALVNAHWQALIQTKVGLELQGRVLSTNQMLAWSMMPLGYITAGPLADKVFGPMMASNGLLATTVGRLIGLGPGRGMGLLMILVGVITVVWTILGYGYRPLRFMEDALPDAIPDAVIVADKDELQKRADRQLLAEAV